MQCKKCKGKMDCTGRFVKILDKDFETFYCPTCKTEDMKYMNGNGNEKKAKKTKETNQTKKADS